MKNKLFRVLILLLSLVPAFICLAITFFSLLESPTMFIFFGAASIIYGEYIYQTFKLFKG